MLAVSSAAAAAAAAAAANAAAAAAPGALLAYVRTYDTHALKEAVGHLLGSENLAFTVEQEWRGLQAFLIFFSPSHTNTHTWHKQRSQES
jgi:hypothetical protein